MLGTSLRPDGFVIKLGISLEQGVQGQLGINGFKTCTFFSLSQFYFFLSWPISLLGFMERIPFLVFNKMWECTCSNSDIVPFTDVVPAAIVT